MVACLSLNAMVKYHCCSSSCSHLKNRWLNPFALNEGPVYPNCNSIHVSISNSLPFYFQPIIVATLSLQGITLFMYARSNLMYMKLSTCNTHLIHTKLIFNYFILTSTNTTDKYYCKVMGIFSDNCTVLKI